MLPCDWQDLAFLSLLLGRRTHPPHRWVNPSELKWVVESLQRRPPSPPGKFIRMKSLHEMSSTLQIYFLSTNHATGGLGTAKLVWVPVISELEAQLCEEGDEDGADYMVVWVEFAKSLQSCPTLCDPIDSSPPGSPSLGFSRQEHWSGLPFPSPGWSLAGQIKSILKKICISRYNGNCRRVIFMMCHSDQCKRRAHVVGHRFPALKRA